MCVAHGRSNEPQWENDLSIVDTRRHGTGRVGETSSSPAPSLVFFSLQCHRVRGKYGEIFVVAVVVVVAVVFTTSGPTRLYQLFDDKISGRGREEEVEIFQAQPPRTGASRCVSGKKWGMSSDRFICLKGR